MVKQSSRWKDYRSRMESFFASRSSSRRAFSFASCLRRSWASLMFPVASASAIFGPRKTSRSAILALYFSSTSAS